MILKLISSLLTGNTSVNGTTSGNAKSLISAKGNKHFFSDMQKALNNSKNGTFISTDKKAKMYQTLNKRGYKYYLESFKKELIAQGKSLNKTFIKEKDLPLVKTLLFQCGFSNEMVEQFLKDIKDSNAGGDINLSQIFLKITEMGRSKREENKNETIESSAVPYIESILRNFNLTPKEVDSIFSQTRNKGGGLDLNKLVTKLEEIEGRSPLKNKVVADETLSRTISEKMEMIGLHIPENGKADQISLKDFISSLKQTTENTYKEKNVSPDIKNTLSKIIERAEFSEQKPASVSFVKVSSDYDFTEPLLTEKVNQKGYHPFNDKKISYLEKNKSGKREYISSFLKQKDGKIQNNVVSREGASNYTGKSDLLSELNAKIELINTVKKEDYHLDTKTELINVTKNTEAFSFTNTLKTVETGEKAFRGYFPDSLIDQVGKQISRSILRGDRVVTLQLKPPDLGTVRIKMDIKDHTLKLGMIAEHQSVKELLLNNAHELKEALLHHGVKLEKLDVQINYNFGQSLNASKGGTDNDQGWRKGFHEGEQFHPDDHTERPPEMPTIITSGSNLLDLMA